MTVGHKNLPTHVNVAVGRKRLPILTYIQQLVLSNNLRTVGLLRKGPIGGTRYSYVDIDCFIC